MKQFFKFTFASLLGFILALVLLGIGVFFMIGALAASGSSKATLKSNSLLKLTFENSIPELTNNVSSDTPFDFSTADNFGLHEIVNAIEYAKTDKKIKGIYLDMNNVAGMGNATASELRAALVDFKNSGKFIISYADAYSESAYYLASAADSVFINPYGGVEFNGFATTIPFMKDMLDRLGIKAQVVYAGKFKSATEPLREYEMTEQNRLQTKEYLVPLYEEFLGDIAASRNLSVADLQATANEYIMHDADDAFDAKLVDGLYYKDQLIDFLKSKLDTKKDVRVISLEDYMTRVKKTNKGKDKIAVIYAEGSIVDGDGGMGSIGGEKYSKLIRKIRKDKKIKAIVLRVNSGGGSGFASEQILRELKLAQEQGITVIASMGDVAASGGYYIACHADTIFAESNTITGSIGVFGIIPSVQETMKKEIGITFDTVKTAQYATGITPFFDMSEAERAQIQESVDDFYNKFLITVGTGRDMDTSAVHEVAQGRVWTGAKAKELGLVDELGGLEEAIQLAATKAGLEKYKIESFPEVKDPIEQFLEELTGQKQASFKDAIIKSELGETYEYYEMLKDIKNNAGKVQARLPYDIIIH